MSAYTLKSYEKTEPLGLYSARACDTDNRNSCTTLYNLYKVNGGYHEGMIGDQKQNFYFVPQRIATDLSYMRNNMMRNKTCLEIDPCDSYVVPLCCKDKPKKQATNTSSPKPSTAVTSEDERKDKNDNDKVWLVLGIVLMVVIVLLMLVLLGFAYYFGR